MQILMIVGSESGNAEMVADCVSDALRADGHDIAFVRDGGVEQSGLDAHRVVLICSSTTGIGDIPQNVRPLFEELEAKRPTLSHLQYGIIGLGDRNYKDSFVGGPKKWDALFAALGGQRVGDRLELDATDNPTPDEDAVEWVKTWIQTVPV